MKSSSKSHGHDHKQTSHDTTFHKNMGKKQEHGESSKNSGSHSERSTHKK